MENETVQVQDVKEDITTASEEKQIVNSVPYARFKETVDEKNELKSKLESINKQMKADTEETKLKQMEDKGEYDKIMSDMTQKLEGAEKKATAWDDYQVSRRDSLLSKLPEDDRAIYDGLSLDKLEVHVDKFNTNPKPKQVDNSIPGTKMGYSSMEEWASTDPKGYEKANNPQTSGNIKVAYSSD
tara:strand:+ start:2801 stop:3355 length:555 start_codon:yes stop_codon:yes gene_type:complete